MLKYIQLVVGFPAIEYPTECNYLSVAGFAN